MSLKKTLLQVAQIESKISNEVIEYFTKLMASANVTTKDAVKIKDSVVRIYKYNTAFLKLFPPVDAYEKVAKHFKNDANKIAYAMNCIGAIYQTYVASEGDAKCAIFNETDLPKDEEDENLELDA